MKQHLTTLLLFISLCFYGQEAVEMEGFYKQNGREYLFFPLVGKEVMHPLHLDLKTDKLPIGLNNTALVKVKGVKLKQSTFIESYMLDFKIEANEVTVVNNNLLLEDYLKEQSKIKPQYPTGPFEAKGFLDVNEDYYSFFYEKLSDFTDIKVRANFDTDYSLAELDSLSKSHSNYNRYRLVKVKGIRKVGIDEFGSTYPEVLITEVTSIEPAILKGYNQQKEVVTYFEEEGFYTGQFEGNDFTWIKDGLFAGSGWTFFDKNIIDSIHKAYNINLRYCFQRGVYMKVKGLRTYGGRYGHFGGWQNQINVSKILELDTTRTKWDYIATQTQRDGYFINDNYRLTFPDILKEGKKYTFTTAVCECRLEAIRIGGYIDYTFTEKQGTDIKSRFSGRLIIDIGSYTYEPNRYPDEIYEDIGYRSTEKKYMAKDGRSAFDVLVSRNKNEQDLIIIAIIDQINSREFGLTELKN